MAVLSAAPVAGWTVTKLDMPPLEDVAKALRAGLAERYQEVEVQLHSSPPDLTQFGWMLPGLGAPTLLDLGDTSFLKIAKCHSSEVVQQRSCTAAKLYNSEVVQQ